MELIVNPVSRSESCGMHDIRRLGYWSACVVMLTVVLFGCAVLLGFLCFSVIYAVLVSIVYYVQLSAVRSASAGLLPFVYTPGSVFFAVDMLGYGFMCLATWFTAGVFDTKNKLSLWIRRLFVFHGWLVFPTPADETDRNRRTVL